MGEVIRNRQIARWARIDGANQIGAGWSIRVGAPNSHDIQCAARNLSCGETPESTALYLMLAGIPRWIAEEATAIAVRLAS